MLATWINQQIVVNGLVNGTVYGLLALAIVLVYRSSRVINFAVGNMGLVGSALFVMMHVKYGGPFWPSLVVALLAGAAYGALVELVVIRRLFTAPRVIVFVATIGVSQLSLAIISAIPEVESASARYPQVIGTTWEVGDARVKGAQLLVILVAPVVMIGLTWFLTRTLFGRAVRAAAGNPDLARLSGVNPKAMSTVVWAIGGLVGTVAMILSGGLDGSATTLTALGPASLLRAIAAAMLGRFVSFRVALLAGVGIGLGESLLRFNYIATPGLTDVVLLLVVLGALAVRSRRWSTEDTVFSFTPRVDEMPARLREVFWVRNLDRIAMLALLAIGVLVPLVITQPSRHLLYASILGFAICALSLTVLTGWAGQLSLGQMAFAGIGALTAAAFARGMEIDWMFRDRQIFYLAIDPLPFVVSILLAGIVTGVLAMIVGVGALRVRGLMLAVVTLALAIAASAYLYRTQILAGGNSTSVPFRRGSFLGIDLTDNRNYYYFVLGALAVCAALVARLRRTGVGRVTVAVRDNETTAAGYTVRPAVAKLRAFALSGAIAGIGGALIAATRQQFDYNDARFLVDGSLRVVSMVVIGGMGAVAGAVIGAVWVVGLPAIAPDNEIIPLLTSSLGLLVLLLYFPGGLVDVAHRARGGIYRWLEVKLPPIEKTATAPPAALSPIRPPVEADVPLRAGEIVVEFGGVRANDAIDLEVRRNEIVGLIGTNGAGKTTLMNAIGGYVPSTGTVELLGRDVSNKQPADRARLGLGRTYQAATLFPELTVRETVEVALEARGRTGMVETILFSPWARSRSIAQHAAAADLIDFLGLGRYADRSISELSTGTRRIVELAGLLALDARVLCLDEPTAGIAQREAEAMGPLLVEIRKELGASMLIIEHDMPLIMSMSDRVYCLELGTVIAEGDPATVRNDPTVIASYLGTDDRAIDRSDALRTSSAPTS